jgi:hypothetical protein
MCMREGNDPRNISVSILVPFGQAYDMDKCLFLGTLRSRSEQKKN